MQMTMEDGVLIKCVVEENDKIIRVPKGVRAIGEHAFCYRMTRPEQVLMPGMTAEQPENDQCQVLVLSCRKECESLARALSPLFPFP